MAFKIPSLPKLCSRNNTQEQFLRKCNGLPDSKFEHLDIVSTLASGSFGLVKLCLRNGQKFVLKECIDDGNDQELFVKEARLMHRLHHENIVKFDSVIECKNKKLAFLMEYVNFDLTPGQN